MQCPKEKWHKCGQDMVYHFAKNYPELQRYANISNLIKKGRYEEAKLVDI